MRSAANIALQRVGEAPLRTCGCKTRSVANILVRKHEPMSKTCASIRQLPLHEVIFGKWIDLD